MKKRDTQDPSIQPSAQGQRQQSAPVAVTASSSRVRLNGAGGGGPLPVLAASASRRVGAGGSVPMPTTLLPKKAVRPSPTSPPATHIIPSSPQPLTSPPKKSTTTTTTSPTPPPAVLSTEAQRILAGIRDFSLPFDLGSDSDNDDDNDGDGIRNNNTLPPSQQQRVGNTPVPATTTSVVKKVSHSMACGGDEPIPDADLREAPATRKNMPLTTPNRVKVSAAAVGTSSSSVAGGDVSSGVGGNVGSDDDSGLVGFNVNPLMRRGRDEHGHFTDVMVMEQRITLLPQFEARGGPLLQAASHDHIPEEVTTTSKKPLLPSKVNASSTSSTSVIVGTSHPQPNGDNVIANSKVSKGFLASVRRAAATYQPVRSVQHGGGSSGGSGFVSTTGIYFAHLIAQH